MSPAHPRDPDVQLEALRTRTLAELEHQFEQERIDRPEFERRRAQAAGAQSPIELRPVVADLLESPPAPLRDAPAVGSFAETAAAPVESGRNDTDHDWAIAIMSGSTRSGHWEPAEHVTALSIMGGIKLDFREAALLEGVVTEVSIFCLMGGVEVLVPPDMHVSVSGTGLLGGFGHVSHTATTPDAPRLHVSGLAVMGGVDVKVRAPGDDDDDDESP